MNMYGESSSDPFELKKLARLRISDADVYTETRVFLIIEIHAITLFNHRIIESSFLFPSYSFSSVNTLLLLLLSLIDKFTQIAHDALKISI